MRPWIYGLIFKWGSEVARPGDPFVVANRQEEVKLLDEQVHIRVNREKFKQGFGWTRLKEEVFRAECWDELETKIFGGESDDD